MSVVNDCDFIERFYQKIEEAVDTDLRVISEIEFVPIDQDLINDITIKLNQKIKQEIKTRNDIISKKVIPTNIKRQFRDAHVDPSLFETYDRSVVEMSDLFKFSKENNIFPDRRRVINAVDNIGHSFFVSFATTFPSISQRMENSDITASEVATMLRSTGLDPNTFSDRIVDSSSSVFNVLDRFLSSFGSGLSQLSSICGLIENVYALMGGQIDSLNNLIALGSDRRFQDLLSRIDPRLGMISNQISSIQSLLEGILDSSKTMEERMKKAFELIAAAQGILLQFFNRSTGEKGKIKIDWDLEAIKEALEDVVNEIEPNKSLFNRETEDGKLIADFDLDGSITMTDVDLFQVYIDYIDAEEQGIEFDEESSILPSLNISLEALIASIEDIFFSYMIENIDEYEDFVNIETQNSNPKDSINLFNQVAGMFGNLSNPSEGDFGQAQLQQMLSLVSSLNSGVDGLRGQLQAISSALQSGSGFSMIDVQSLMQQIQQIRQLAQIATSRIFGDQTALMEQFRETTREALEEAEDVATTDPERTREISESRMEALREEIARVTALVGTANSELSGELLRQLQALETQLEGAAATGIIEHIDQQMQDRIRSAAQRLRSSAELFDIESLSNNGVFNNMQNAFARMARLLAAAREAGSERGAERTIAAARGVLTDQTDRTTDIRRPQAEFVALRFCRLANEIDRIFDSFLEPVQQMITQFTGATTAMGAASDEPLQGVFSAGGIRLNREARIAAARAAGTSIPATVARPHIDPGTGARTTVPPGGTIPSGLDTIPPAAFNGLPRYDDVFGKTWQGLIRYSPGPISRRAGRRGWDGLRPDMLSRLVSLAREWVGAGNPPLTINSALRLGSRGYHPRGMAVDVSMPSPRSQLLFANLAYRAGFRGIGSYRTFIHIDTGPQRSWAGGNTSRFGYFDYVNNRFPRYGNRTVQFNLSGSLGSRSFI